MSAATRPGPAAGSCALTSAARRGAPHVAPRWPPFARLDVSESDVQCCSLPNGLACPAAGLPASDGSGGAKPPFAGPFLAAAPRRARIARHASSPASSAAATMAAITMPARAAPRSALSAACGAASKQGQRLAVRERVAVSSALTACAAQCHALRTRNAHGVTTLTAGARGRATRPQWRRRSGHGRRRSR